MYVYVDTHTYICILHVHLIHTYIHTYIRTYVCIYMYLRMHIHVHIHMRTPAHKPQIGAGILDLETLKCNTYLGYLSSVIGP